MNGLLRREQTTRLCRLALVAATFLIPMIGTSLTSATAEPATPAPELSSASSPSTEANPEVADVSGSRRVVVIGDVQGAHDSLVSLLRHAGLVDGELRWSGDDSILVQTGDLVDKGVRVKDVLDLMMRLRREAPASGGQVIVLMGNHEAMNILGELRDVSYMAYETFAGDDAAAQQDEAYRSHVRWLRERAEAIGQEPPVIDDAFKADWLAAHPLGFHEYVASMAADGVYGRWLRTLPVAVRIDGLLLMHGGISPALADLDLDAVNRLIHDEIRAFDTYRANMAELGLTPAHASVRTMAETLVDEIEHLNSLDRSHRDRDRALRAAELQDLTGWGSWNLINEKGPLWFRGPSRWDEPSRADEMLALINGLGASSLICGQSGVDARIATRFDGRVLLVSTGMSDDPWEKREPGFLEIRDGMMSAVTLHDRTVLQPPVSPNP